MYNANVPSTTRSNTRLSKQTTTSKEATSSLSRDCHRSGARLVVASLSRRPSTLLRRNSASFCRARKSRISTYGVPNGNDCGLLESLPGSFTSLRKLKRNIILLGGVGGGGAGRQGKREDGEEISWFLNLRRASGWNAMRDEERPVRSKKVGKISAGAREWSASRVWKCQKSSELDVFHRNREVTSDKKSKV